MHLNHALSRIASQRGRSSQKNSASDTLSETLSPQDTLTGQVVEAFQDIRSQVNDHNIAGMIASSTVVLQDYLALPEAKRKEFADTLIEEKKALIDIIKIEADEMASITPVTSETAYTAGSFYLQARDYVNAEIWLRKAVELDPENAGANNDLGYVILNQCDFNSDKITEAAGYMNKAKLLDPAINNANLKACADYSLYAQKAAQGQPVDFTNKGILQLAFQNIEGATISFYNAIQQDKNNAEAKNNLAFCYLYAGRFEEAMNLALEGCTLNLKLPPNNLIAISVMLKQCIKYAAA